MPDKKTKRPLAKFALIGGLLAAAGSHLHHHGRGRAAGTQAVAACPADAELRPRRPPAPPGRAPARPRGRAGPASPSQREQVGHGLGQVEARVERGHDVGRVLGHDDVGHREAPAGRQHGGDAREEVGLGRPVEVVDGERGEDEVERALGQRVAQVLQAQVGAGQVGRREHVLAGVDAGQLRVRMACEHAPRGDARPGPQLEHPPRVDALGRARQLVLHAVVVGHLRADHLEVAVRIPVELPHAAKPMPPRRQAQAAASSARSRPAALAW